MIKESMIMSYNSLILNKLRTFLSLMGITIGIFAIISVFTVIDSLKREIRTSIESLGNNVIYIQKWPWEFGSDYPWWKYLKRPIPQIKDLEELQKRSTKTEALAFNVSTERTVQYKNNSLESVVIIASSFDFDKIYSFEIEKGRYFSSFESKSGAAKAIIGYELAKSLYGNEDPIEKEVKVSGSKIKVIGVFKKEGKSNFKRSFDNTVLIPINYARNILNVRNESMDPLIMAKPKPGISVNEYSDELKGIMRTIRKLKPKEEDNFALNRASMISKGIESIFLSVDLAGIIIGGFAILVGGFGIANIMFVSVKERTKIIGIQKSLGAKKYFILLEFLYESVFLSLLGGTIGLLLIYSGTLLTRMYADLNFSMSFENVAYGIGISVIIGIVSGFAPAYSASRLNPVEAMNSNF